MTTFDLTVLLLILVSLGWWLWRYIARTFSAKCPGSGCHSCNGCSKGGRPD